MLRGARGRGSAPTARSRCTPTATRSPSCRRRSARCPGAVQVLVPRMSAAARRSSRAARAVGGLARRAGRGGGTSLPGKVLMRARARTRSPSSPARLPRGTAVDLGDQRQDDDGRDGRLDPRARRRRAGPQPRRARTWPAGSPRRCWRPPAAAARSPASSGLFEVDEFWLDQVVAAAAPRAMLLGNLFRDQLDRYGELETIADRWAAVVAGAAADRAAGAQRRRPADRRPRARRAERHLLRRRGRRRWRCAEMQHASDSKHCRRCGAAYVYDAVYLGHLGRYHCPQLRSASARRRRSRPSGSRSTARAAPRSRCARRPDALDGRAAAARPLQRLQRARRRGAVPRARRRRSSRSSPAWRRSTAAFGRAETVADRRRRAVDPADQEPRRAPTRSCARSRSRPASSTCSAILNDRIADGRDVSWVWDADFELLAAARAPRRPAPGTRAAELALRLKYAGVPVGAAARRRRSCRRRSTRRSARRASGRLFALPTYTALLELREELAARGHVRAVLGAPVDDA